MNPSKQAAKVFAGFFGQLSLALGVGFLTHCDRPMRVGMYGHRPEAMWNEPVSHQPDVAPCGSSFAVVLKRFESHALVPSGGHFAGDSPQKGIMTQLYVPISSIETSLYEATYAALVKAGIQVWKDYDPNPLSLVAPPATQKFVVIAGMIEAWEIHTFDSNSNRLDEASRLEVSFRLLPLDPRAPPQKASALVRIGRGDGDLMGILGHHLAASASPIICKWLTAQESI